MISHNLSLECVNRWLGDHRRKGETRESEGIKNRVRVVFQWSPALQMEWNTFWRAGQGLWEWFTSHSELSSQARLQQPDCGWLHVYLRRGGRKLHLEAMVSWLIFRFLTFLPSLLLERWLCRDNLRRIPFPSHCSLASMQGWNEQLTTEKHHYGLFWTKLPPASLCETRPFCPHGLRRRWDVYPV